MAKGWDGTPWTMTVSDYLDRQVLLTVTYNANNLNITNPGLTGHRDPGCVYDLLMVGRPDDGTMRTFPIPEGDFSVSRGRLNSAGFQTIDDVLNANVTIGRA